jgi:hypothetical protein
MTLEERIEQAFEHRRRPAEVVDIAEYRQFDSDVEEALWFVGRDWREITWEDWQRHTAAITYFSRDSFAYYLPSVLILSAQNPTEVLDPAQSLIWDLDRSPIVGGWNENFERRFLGLRSEEYDLIKEWLVLLCEYKPYKSYGSAASGPGDTFGRAYDTVDLLKKETERRHLVPSPGRKETG